MSITTNLIGSLNTSVYDDLATDGTYIYATRAYSTNRYLRIYSGITYLTEVLLPHTDVYGLLCKNECIIVGVGKPTATTFKIQAYKYNTGTGNLDLISTLTCGPLPGYGTATGNVARLCDGPGSYFFASLKQSGIGVFTFDGAILSYISYNYGDVTWYCDAVSFDGTYVYGAFQGRGVAAYSFSSGTLTFIKNIYIAYPGYSGDYNNVSAGDSAYCFCIAVDLSSNYIYAGSCYTYPNLNSNAVWVMTFNGSDFNVIEQWIQDPAEIYGSSYMFGIAAGKGCFYTTGRPLSIVYFDGSAFSTLESINVSSDGYAVAYGNNKAVLHDRGADYIHLYDVVDVVSKWFGDNYDYGESPLYKDEDTGYNNRHSLHYGIEIFTDDGTPQHNVLPITDSTLAIVNGVIRYVSDRPNYDGSTVIPSYSADGELSIDGSALTGQCTDVWYENFLTDESISENPSTEIDITEAGGIGSLSGFSFSVTNFDKIYKDYEDAGIYLINRKVRFWIFVDDIMYCRWQGVISNDPYNDINYTIQCEPDFNKLRTVIPPLLINTTTHVNSADFDSMTKTSVISPSVSTNTKNVESVPVPICIGDVPHAKLFNVSGSLQPEIISYSVPAGKYSYVTPAIASGNGLTGTLPFKSEYGVTGVAIKTNSDTTGDYTPGSTWFDKNCLIINTGTGDFVANSTKNAYYLMLSYRMMYNESAVSNLSTLLTDPNTPQWVIDSINSNIQPFNDYYVYKQGSDKGIRINHSWLTWINLTRFATETSMGGAYILILELDEKPEDFESLNTMSSLTYDGNALRSSNTQTSYYNYEGNISVINSDSRDTSFFYISKSYLNYIVSNSNIDKFNNFLVNGEVVTTGFPVLYSYNKDTDTYDNLYASSVDSSIGATGSYLYLSSPSSITTDGESYVTTALPIPLSSLKNIEMEQLYWYIVPAGTISAYISQPASLMHYYTNDGTGLTGDISNLLDRDRETYNTVNCSSTGTSGGIHAWRVSFKIDSKVLPLADFTDEEKLYFGADIIAKTVGLTGDRYTIHQMMSYRVYDQYDKLLSTDSLISSDVDDRTLYITGGLQSHHAYPSRTDNFCDALSLSIAEQDAFVPYNNLPNEYYYCGGNSGNEQSKFGESKLLHFENTSSVNQIDITKVKDYVLNGKSDGYIYIDIFICVSDSSGKHLRVAPVPKFDIQMKLREIGFVVEKKISYSEDVYTEVSGEKTIAGDKSNNPYNAIKLITETYCGLTGSLVSYGDLPTTRGATSSWCNFGKQLTEQKQAVEYVKDICQQGYIGLFQNRKGVYQYKTFEGITGSIYNSDVIDSKAQVTILRDSLQLNKTSVDRCYNDITVQYNYNKGSDTYDKQLIISNIDDTVTVTGHTGGTGFPAIGVTGNYGTPLWLEYCSFPGIPSKPVTVNAVPDTATIPLEYSCISSATTGGFTAGHQYVWYGSSVGWIDGEYQECYDVAKTLWEPCNLIYKKLLNKTKLPDNLLKLIYTVDKSIMQADSSKVPVTYRKYLSAAKTAIEYTKKIVSWTTQQKIQLKYDVPITDDTVKYDLLTPVFVKDKIFTLDIYKLGYMTKVESDVLAGKIALEVTLKP